MQKMEIKHVARKMLIYLGQIPVMSVSSSDLLAVISVSSVTYRY
jgi:hypothetical protein